MRVIKIIDKAPLINKDGKWRLFCQIHTGNSYVYGFILCNTMDEAYSIKANQVIDSERFHFVDRISKVIK